MNTDYDSLKGKNVYIFGAGIAGESAVEQLDKSVNVLGFIDNDSVKVGAFLSGYAVFQPSHLSSAKFDMVLVASEYFEQITVQLLKELKISKDKIFVLPARMMKPVSLGESAEITSNALSVLFTVTGLLNLNNVNYYIDAGTLLGIYRDEQLIPWDDDLDLAINADDLDSVTALMADAQFKLEALFGVSWELVEHIERKGFGAVPKGAVRALQLKPSKPNTELPVIDYFIKYIDGDIMDYSLSSRSIRMPSKHLLNTVETRFKERVLRFPGDVESYLSAHYGEWRTPVRDWNLGMLKNATVFES